MIVIADTAPINYLVLIGEVALLPKLYGGIAIPQGVLFELLAEKAPEPVRRWAANRQAGLALSMWIRRR